MQLRATLNEWRRTLSPFIVLAVIIAATIAISWFLSSRTAAVLIGVLAGFGGSYYLMRRARHTTKIAILWASVGIIADAAYAKLNDQAPVTIANALTKLVDSFVKLADALVKSTGIVAVDARAKIVAVTPDFVWALILSLAFSMWLAFLSRRDSQSDARKR